MRTRRPSHWSSFGFYWIKDTVCLTIANCLPQLMKSLCAYAHDVINAFCRIPGVTGFSFWKEISFKSKLWYSMKLLETLYNLSKIGSKFKLLRNMKLHTESKYRIETERQWKTKTPKFSWILISFTRYQLDNFEKMLRKWKLPFSKFTVFTIFYFSKT